MLVFEPGQLHAFAEAAFITRMADVLCAMSGIPKGAAPAEEIAEQLRRARKHGFTEERDCARWVLCAWCLGRDFDRKIAPVAELLARDDIGPAYKGLALEVMMHGIFFALAGRSRLMP